MKLLRKIFPPRGRSITLSPAATPAAKRKLARAKAEGDTDTLKHFASGRAATISSLTT